jgi:hypothetical protein
MLLSRCRGKCIPARRDIRFSFGMAHAVYNDHAIQTLSDAGADFIREVLVGQFWSPLETDAIDLEERNLNLSR